MQPPLKDLALTMPKGRAGRRFQDRYVAARKSRNDVRWTQRGLRIIRLVIALVAVAIAVVLMFIPGPAIVFYFIAGALLAAESLTIARLMDWLEVRLRALWRWGKGHWGNMPQWGRAGLIVAVICLSATSTYISYRLFME
jgi:hypothetical protein